jgi:NTE family protein
MIFDDPIKANRLWQWPGILLVTCITLVYLAGSAWLVHASDAAKSHRPKIGLVLSGGGARGAAHIGVLKVLEQLRIPIDCLAGTSMGSIVGGLYASGMTPAEIEAVVTRVDWADALKDNIPRENRSFRRKTEDKNYLVQSKPGLSDDLKIKLPLGLRQGQRVDLLLEKLVMPISQVKNFDDFRIPFRAVATDIATGKPVVMSAGNLALTMRASMSIPAIFSAAEMDGRLLVDGGVSNNLPVDVVRAMGADIVIAIDISTPLKTRDQLNSTIAITGQLTGILTRSNTEEQIATLTDKDILIVPDLGDITNSSFDRADEAIPIGLAAAEKHKQTLSRLSVSETVYADYRSSQQGRLSKRQPAPPVSGFIRLDNQSRLSDEVIFARLQVKKDAPLDVAQLDKDIGNIYGLELFENIYYEIVEENGQTGLLIHIKERSWGPNYIQAGLSLAGNQDGDNFYNSEFAYTRTAINRLNGEWRSAIQLGHSPGVATEIYQPLSYSSRYFIHPRLAYNKKTVNLYSGDGDKLAEYRVTQYGGDLALGREFGTWGEARIGIRRLTGDAEINVGQPAWPDYDFDRGEVYAKLSADKLDNFNFPREGYYGFVEYVKSEESLGADSEFDQMGMEANVAMSWEKNTVLLGTKIHATMDDDAPLQNRFELGGLFNLSGFNDDELSGQQMGLLRLVYMRQISDFNLLPTYIGMSVESGNVWEKKSDMAFDDLIFAGSIFLGVDTFLGPVYIGYGKAESNHDSFYFYLGKLF